MRDPSGKTTLTIPPGALEKDTDITLALQEPSAGALTQVSEFSPDGLKFLKPVTLAIKADASLAPAGTSLAVAMFDGSAFKPVDGATYAKGVAAAAIMHFSKYSVVIIDGRAVAEAPATCAAAESAFAPCGGDPKGTWTFSEFCAPPGDVGKVDGCPELTGSIDYEFKRDVVIDATSITLSPGSSKATITVNYPSVCFGRLADGGLADIGPLDCAAMQNEFFTKQGKVGTCVGAPGGCTCTTSVEQAVPESETSTYTVSGSTMITTDKDGTTSSSDFCVRGDIVTSKSKDAAKGELFVLKRK